MPASKKKPAAKRVVAKKTTSRAPKMPKYETFKVASSDMPFMSFKLTQQTFYWTLLLIVVLLVQVWVLSMQIDVTNLLNQVETQMTSTTK